MYSLRKVAVTAVAMFVLCYGLAPARQMGTVTVVLTFDQETGGLKHGSPIRGVSLSGVTFDFTRDGLASIDALYGGVIHRTPGAPRRVLTFVQEPAIEGNAQGVLTMTFAAPTAELRFGIARSTTGASAAVSLSDDKGRLISTTQVPLTTSGAVSEGVFSFSAPPGRPVKRAVVSFPNAAINTRFAIDNLTFNVPA
jgi:hypothetical protein